MNRFRMPSSGSESWLSTRASRRRCDGENTTKSRAISVVEPAVEPNVEPACCGSRRDVKTPAGGLNNL